MTLRKQNVAKQISSKLIALIFSMVLCTSSIGYSHAAAQTANEADFSQAMVIDRSEIIAALSIVTSSDYYLNFTYQVEFVEANPITLPEYTITESGGTDLTSVVLWVLLAINLAIVVYVGLNAVVGKRNKVY